MGVLPESLKNLGRRVAWPFLFRRRTRRITQTPQREPNHYWQLLQLLEKGRYVPAYGLWNSLGRPSRGILLKMANIGRHNLSKDVVVVKFGRFLLDKHYVVQERDGLFWSPHWLLYTDQSSLMQRALS